jgi:tagatose 1,6-diphosphate aldolase
LNRTQTGKPETRLSGAFGVAIDQGSGLERAIAEARGTEAQPDDLLTFKRSVVEVLSPEASVVLLDAKLGQALLPSVASSCDAQLAFEDDVYSISSTDRTTRLPQNLRIDDLASMGIRRLKFFTYYAPRGSSSINAQKQALVKWLGEQCKSHQLEFLFEPLVYDEDVTDSSGAEFASLKPTLVRDAARLFSDPSFGVDVLKLEVPVNLNFVAGMATGKAVHTREQALQYFRETGATTSLPIVYLSAGVSFAMFCESLVMARLSGSRFSGFMCGRAIWSDAIPVFGAQGETGLREWLGRVGLDRLRSLKVAASGESMDSSMGFAT